jgi:hypothetical protein
MEEKIIYTRRGQYGRVNITLPINIKISLMDCQKRSGYKKAEFLRLALMTGYVTISRNIENNNNYFISENELSQQFART